MQPAKSTYDKEIIVPPSFIPLEYFKASLAHFEKNPLYKYLCRVFGEAEAQDAFHPDGRGLHRRADSVRPCLFVHGFPAHGSAAVPLCAAACRRQCCFQRRADAGIAG